MTVSIINLLSYNFISHTFTIFPYLYNVNPVTRCFIITISVAAATICGKTVPRPSKTVKEIKNFFIVYFF